MSEKKYIDADKLTQDLKELKAIIIKRFGLHDEYVDCIEQCIDMIKLQSATDVEEVRHGKWKFDEDECVATCTVCGTVYEDRGDTVVDYWNYCPACGAKLDKEKEK